MVVIPLLICFLAPTLGNAAIASRWRELHGNTSWAGLLDPIDVDLRRSIINYGELTQATSDGFNREKRSPHCGACRYGYSDLLSSTEVSGAGHYAVTKFVYATSALLVPEAFMVFPAPEMKEKAWSRESNWMGYVAVATDAGVAALGRRDIVVAWRGTVTDLEWVNDFDFTPVSAAPVLGAAAAANPLAMVHRGFLSIYTSSNANSKYNTASARDQASYNFIFYETQYKHKHYYECSHPPWIEIVHKIIHLLSLKQVLGEVRRLMELYKDEVTSITITGHSLGASLATLNAVDIVANGLNAPSSSTHPPCPVTAIVFASPHVGERFFKSAFRSFPNLRALHVKNAGDIVPKYPPVAYVDVAVPLQINTARSPYLSSPGPVETLHNLELYLHGVAGDQGSAGGFKLEVDRDVALVNKGIDALKYEYPVPANWWVPKNKGMVKNADGKWELKDFEHI
ncbi:hypothetical protein PR202_ga11002 [Eleusine coracana subsp. coracana]|uniref:Phospholipase A1 n=1 Tax=Eleusine coracana subsp. coracana TaxID=191504 RepID=A0AAV5C866_ELECO|nr:hypothetical protein PR202_ga11002 [Eleusine coracana subsp. coracana]